MGSPPGLFQTAAKPPNTGRCLPREERGTRVAGEGQPCPVPHALLGEGSSEGTLHWLRDRGVCPGSPAVEGQL